MPELGGIHKHTVLHTHIHRAPILVGLYSGITLLLATFTFLVYSTHGTATQIGAAYIGPSFSHLCL